MKNLTIWVRRDILQVLFISIKIKFQNFNLRDYIKLNMKSWFGLLLLLVSATVGKLIIYYPPSLREAIDPVHSEISSSIANFGNIPYGHSVLGRVWFDPDNALGCDPFDIKITGEGDPDNEPSPIVVVKRGECSFVKKVRNIEHAGGALAVIIDNKEDERTEDVIMVDDGTGNGINIPSLLITKKDGEAIINEIKACSMSHKTTCVQLVARFDLPHPDNRVEYDLWYSSSSEKSLDFIKNFGEYHLRFKEDVYFTPRFVVWGCLTWDNDMVKRNCFGSGKYCALQYGNRNHTGQEIIYENLREKWLHEYVTNIKAEEKWWKYMHNVHASCRDDITEDCSMKALDKLGIPFDEIRKCVNDSFETRDHSSSANKYLEKDVVDWKNKGPHFFPALVINNVTYRGFLNPEHVFDAICKGFKDAPSECSQGSSGSGKYNGISMKMLLLIIWGVLICNFGLLLLYRRYQQREMSREIKMTANAAVSQYFAVANFDKDERPKIREL